MPFKSRTWFLLSILLFVAAAFFWRLGEKRRAPLASGGTNSPAQPFRLALTNAALSGQAPATISAAPVLAAASAARPNPTNWLRYRLTNTSQSIAQLTRNERALLLRNALYDTAVADRPEIPAHLRAAGDPGSYIVQARGQTTDLFRRRIADAGGEIISYIPNNAYLVRASRGAANRIRSAPQTQAVLPFEPYYKLAPALLPLAVNQELSPFGRLTVVTFPGEAERVTAALENLGAEVIARPLSRMAPANQPAAAVKAEQTALGDILVVKAPADSLARVAQIPEVHMVGVFHERQLANDLSRVKVRVSTNTTTPPPQSHYATANPPNLTGAGVLVAVADTGVDATHPDFTGPGGVRVFGDPLVLTDVDGHGTHVIGTLLGNGMGSTMIGSNALGSTNGAYYTGVAPNALAFVQDLVGPDSELQRNAALTNALISNNSWGYPDSDYDIFAASYDIAVRDSLPGVTGPQDVAYVFASGNDGGGSGDGLSGIAGSVVSPATAKNVITVGASELPRFITNEVVVLSRNETNHPWAARTDSDNQVAGFSSRGNVGIGIEGEAGRFKPDVIAPGSMVVSCRSVDYVDPQGSTNRFRFDFNSLTIAALRTNLFSLFIPANAIEVEIRVVPNSSSPDPFPELFIDAEIDAPPTPPPLGTNRVIITPPDLREGTLFYNIGNATTNAINYDLVVFLTQTNDLGNFFQVQQALNEPLKPYYRYESGTSMAAATISGMLALFQEYLGTNFSLRPSPALLKAMLINGARSLSVNYNLQTTAPLNHQGWGIASMSNSIPSGMVSDPAMGPVRLFDQSSTNALSTGDAHLYTVTVPDEARSYPLRVTLVWTDPPGNPVASLKLVNDLDLSVVGGETTNTFSSGSNVVSRTNLFIGNNFPAGSDFTDPLIASSTDTNLPAITNVAAVVDLLRDTVNNVENVYIAPPLAGSYTIAVKAHRVNVNAVNSHTNGIVQDYALVVASGNVAPSNNVNLVMSGPTMTNSQAPFVVGLTNKQILINQRAGANSQFITTTNGATNQWAFYQFTNSTSLSTNGVAFTNVAVITFLPPNLARSRLREADIDLYVARDGEDLTTLDPAIVGRAGKSVTRGGTEFVAYTDAKPDEVFTIGVKSEDQQSALFGIFAVASQSPFNSRDTNGNIIADALNVPADIPDGTPDNPGGVQLFALVLEPEVTVRRIYVTNVIGHEEPGDLIGTLFHADIVDQSEAFATLNNHRTWDPFTEGFFLYDDSEEGDLEMPFAPFVWHRSDGPGTLRSFSGQQAMGVWRFEISDNALFHTGLVERLTLVIEPASTNGTDPLNITRDFAPNRWFFAPINVPADATNLQVCLSQMSGGSLDLYVRRGDFPTFTEYDKALTNIQPPGACLDLGITDIPPLNPGRYFVGVYNPGPTPVRATLTGRVMRDLRPNNAVPYHPDDITTILDDATTNSFIFVTNRGIITKVEVGVRIDHPRASDLVLHLVSPQGLRILLAENRGRDSTTGYGVTTTNRVTNVLERVFENGFEGSPPRTNYDGGGTFRAAGWELLSGTIDIFSTGISAGAAHSGTNFIDINGSDIGVLRTNVTLNSSKLYRITYAYARNPDSIAVGVEPTAMITFSGRAGFSFFVLDTQVNSWDNLNWKLGSIVVYGDLITSFLSGTNAPPAPGTNINYFMRIEGTSPGPHGVLFDSVRIEEIEIEENLILYATFTDDPAKALTPIKFAPPPFGDTNFVPGDQLISNFEGLLPRTYTSGEFIDSFVVVSNTVAITNIPVAFSGSNYLNLKTGVVSHVRTTVPGKEYVLSFATRAAPPNAPELFYTGVDDFGLPLPIGSVDPHYQLIFGTAYTVPANTSLGWLSNNAFSQWISPGTNETTSHPAGSYVYRTRFDLTGFQRTNVDVRAIVFPSGDALTNVLLNGVSLGTSFGPLPALKIITPNRPDVGGGFVNIRTTNFVDGINTLEFVVENPAPGPTAFRAELEVMSSPIPGFNFGASAQIRLPGVYTNDFTAESATWQRQSVTFVARSNNTRLEFAGRPRAVWLDDIQIRETGNRYFQPEEPLAPLVGQRAFGRWRLEVWDNRLGAVITNELINWQLSLTFLNTNAGVAQLNDQESVGGVLNPGRFAHFLYTLPACSTGTVDISLSTTTGGPLNLFLNPLNPPTGTSPNDILLLAGVTNSVAVPFPLGAPPFVGGARFYLAVENASAMPNDYLFAVDAECAGVPVPGPSDTVIAASSLSYDGDGFTFEWTGEPGDEYTVQYSDTIPPNWKSFAGTVRSTTSRFSFTDDGTQTGGRPAQRFYRLIRGAEPADEILPIPRDPPDRIIQPPK